MSAPNALPPQPRERRIGLLYLTAASGVLLGHLALISYFVTFRLMLSHEPIQGADFDTHIGQTYRVLEGLAGWGRSWVYDVKLLAGQPEGTLFDADNKGWELLTFALWKLGLSKGQAFNVFVLLAHVCLPFVMFASARLFELDRWSCLLVTALGSGIWFFDSWVHWGWWIGMVSYTAASFLVLLPLGLFYRYLERGSWWAGVACAPALALTHLVHPYSFFILAAPCAALYFRAFSRLRASGHALVAAIIGTTLAVNAYWIRDAVTHWHYVLDSAFFGRTGVSYLVADFFDVLIDASDTGVIGTRAALRFVCLALTVALLLVWRRSGDRRFLPLATGIAVLFGLSYFGSYLSALNQIQPYRHVIPLAFMAALGAGAAVPALLREGALRGLSRASRMLLAVALMGACQHVAFDVLYFLPRSLPSVPPLIDGHPSPLMALGHPTHPPYTLPYDAVLTFGMEDVVRWAQTAVPPGTRVLIEEPLLGEHIAWKTGVEVIGGFRHRNIGHSFANLYRHSDQQEMTPDRLRKYLRTFAVEWIITPERRPNLDRAAGVVVLAGQVGLRQVYRVLEPSGRVLEGGGRVVARTNRIDVHASDPARNLLLAYHFHEKLVCEPACRIERVPDGFDDVGLLRVPAPHPADLALVLRY